MMKNKQYEVVMPKLGLIMTEALLVEWHKQDGEWVKTGEPLFSLESEKSTIEIESPANGRVQIVVAAGETVPVMTPVAYVLEEGDAVVVTPAETPSISVEAAPIQPAVAVSDTRNGVRATPLARKLAQQQGIDLSVLTGSGPRGMIVKADLRQPSRPSSIRATPVARKMAAELGLELHSIVGTGKDGCIGRSDVADAMAALVSQSKTTAPGPSQALPLSGLRGVIADRLTAGWRERPQVTVTTEVDATNLVSARQQFIAETGQKRSYNAFFMAAAAQALQEQPHVNACLTDAGIVQLAEINIGLAVDTERGLLVPVVRDAGSKSIETLDKEIGELAQRALSGESLPDELSGGTFTITNLGAFRIDAFTPIINPPEMAILGIGRIAPRPMAVGRQLEVRDTVTLSLSFDHRLLDGGPAARFLQRIAELIERPIVLISRS